MRVKSSVRLGLLLFVLTGVVAAGWLHAGWAAPEQAAGVRAAVGFKAPAFILADMNGQQVALREVAAENKVTLINFWGIWCPYCIREIPDFAAFYQQYRKRGVTVLGVDVGDNPADLPAFVKKNKMAYPILIDKDQSVSRLYQVSGFPTTFFLNRQGKIKDMIIGATDGETLKKRVAALLTEP